MDYSFISGTNLFKGISEEDVKSLILCLKGHEKTYAKDLTIYRTGETVTEIGLVLEGSVNIVMNFYWGGSNIISHVERGKIFAETYAAIPGKELLCDVVAAEPCRILFLKLDGILRTCSSLCSYHNQIIHNLIAISALHNLNLSTRMMHTASKSIRERLLSYLSSQAIQSDSRSFSIPFSRQQLADYLSVDRSALSNELSKMQKDGLIGYHKNDFTLNDEYQDY